MKASYPVQVSEYAVANNIEYKPALAWWSKVVIRKRNRIISKVKLRYSKTTHKFFIWLPKNVACAFELYHLNANEFLRKCIELEMGKAIIAFQKVDDFTLTNVGKTKHLWGIKRSKAIGSLILRWTGNSQERLELLQAAI